MTEPIWHKPAWVTAIVGLVSAFLTVPQVIGNYYVKQQEIAAASISNKVALQQQEFVVVKETLAQSESDRIMFLRYLVATLKDDTGRAWANAEVIRLDKISESEQEQKQLQKEIEQLQSELESVSELNENTKLLKDRLNLAQKDLTERVQEISLLRASAGVSVNERNSYPYIGGSWIVAMESKRWVDQSGEDGGRLTIYDQVGNVLETGKFDGPNSFWLVKPGSSMSHGTVSNQGTKITWRNGGFNWARSIRKSDN